MPLILSFSWLSACGGGGSSNNALSPPTTVTPPATASCGVDSQKDFVLAVAEDWYLWYDEMATVNAADFDTAAEYLSALTAPLAEDFRDPGFSYLTTRAEDEANFTSGAFVGFGFRFAIDDAGRYLISDAFEGAPASQAGFVRGAEIVAVDTGNGFVSMGEYESRGDSINTIFGGPVEGLERGFRMRIDGQLVDLAVNKAELDVPPLAAAPRTLERPGLPPAGYIHLRSFTLSAEPELDDVFAELTGQGITDFVVDLRYNGGGLVDVADRFLDLLGGEIANGEVAYEISHNDKRVSENANYVFNTRADSAAPLRIAFITSDATASASELLINSLEPFVEVVLVGSDTSGKAVGQYAFDQSGCETRLRMVSFESVNGEGFGGFYTGLIDTGRFTLCELEDEFTGAFGSADEALTAGALAWLNEGVCPASVGITNSSGRALRRGPARISGFDRPDRRSFWVQ
ncbi:MAG: S41 family peptidase [Congregibacter sp.]